MHQEKMLPRNLPKFGNFLVNPTPQFSRIELDIEGHQPGFSFQRNSFAFEDTLIRGLGYIIAFDGLVANAFFGNQFERRLKEVDIEPQIVAV